MKIIIIYSTYHANPSMFCGNCGYIAQKCLTIFISPRDKFAMLRIALCRAERLLNPHEQNSKVLFQRRDRFLAK